MYIYQHVLFQDSGYLRKLPAIFRNGCLDVFYKKVFSKALQNSQENLSWSLFLLKLQPPSLKEVAWNFIKKIRQQSHEFFGASIFISQAKLLKMYFQLI